MSKAILTTKKIASAVAVGFLVFGFFISGASVPNVCSAGLDLQIDIPGYVFNEADSSTGNIANYVKAIYKYLIGIVGIVAAIALMVGGVIWLTAGGSADKVGQAKDIISSSLTGLVIALCSFLILGTINPDLVNFKVENIGQIGSKDTSGNNSYQGKGCCFLKQNISNIIQCDWVTSKENCASDVYYPGKTCDQIEGCPQQYTQQKGCCQSDDINVTDGCVLITREECGKKRDWTFFTDRTCKPTPAGAIRCFVD